jgi:hypothetical protein
MCRNGGAGGPRQPGESSEQKLVEAAGIEPLLPLNSNAMMANDFGSYRGKTFELPRRFFSSGVLPSLGEIMETAWYDKDRRRQWLLNHPKLRIANNCQPKLLLAK